MEDFKRQIAKLLGQEEFLDEVLRPLAVSSDLTPTEHNELHGLVIAMTNEAIRRMFLSDTRQSIQAVDRLFTHGATCTQCMAKLETLLNAPLTQAEIDEMSE